MKRERDKSGNVVCLNSFTKTHRTFEKSFLVISPWKYCYLLCLKKVFGRISIVKWPVRFVIAESINNSNYSGYPAYIYPCIYTDIYTGYPQNL